MNGDRPILYCLVAEAYGREQLAQCCYLRANFNLVESDDHEYNVITTKADRLRQRHAEF